MDVNDKDAQRHPVRAAMYSLVLPGLVEVANGLGYCLAVHGSLYRDFDVVAIPWTNEACEPDELVNTMADKFGLLVFDRDNRHQVRSTKKPHGRLAYSIYFERLGLPHPYIDISVMPRMIEEVQLTT